MQITDDQFASLLLSTFVESEREFLKAQTAFTMALDSARTTFDLERLRALAEQLLDAHGQANPSAKLYRQSRGLITPPTDSVQDALT